MGVSVSGCVCMCECVHVYVCECVYNVFACCSISPPACTGSMG